MREGCHFMMVHSGSLLLSSTHDLGSKLLLPAEGSPMVVMLEVRIQENCISEYLEATCLGGKWGISILWVKKFKP